VPLLNVLLPFAAKSFPLIFCADVVAVVGVYAWKVRGRWCTASRTAVAPVPATTPR
jgi:hypothetical protein